MLISYASVIRKSRLICLKQLLLSTKLKTLILLKSLGMKFDVDRLATNRPAPDASFALSFRLQLCVLFTCSYSSVSLCSLNYEAKISGNITNSWDNYSLLSLVIVKLTAFFVWRLLWNTIVPRRPVTLVITKPKAKKCLTINSCARLYTGSQVKVCVHKDRKIWW
jgi:hypothetical protein